MQWSAPLHLKAPTFRHKMFDGYKAQRKGMPEELAQQLPLVKQLLESMGYPIITREGYEADDILGTLSALCEQSGDQCFIATGDRDSLQLIGKNTVVLLASSRMGKNETLLCDEDYFFQKYGTIPQRLVDIKALMGDSSDNIPGVAGIGEKTALKLVGQYGDIDHIYADLDALEVSKSIRAKLEQGKESAYLSRTLATIDRSVPLGLSLADCLPKPRDEQALFQLLSQLEMNSMIKKLGLHGEYHPTQALDTASPDLPALCFCADPLSTLLDTLPEETPISLLPCFDSCHRMSALALAVWGPNCPVPYAIRGSSCKGAAARAVQPPKPEADPQLQIALPLDTAAGQQHRLPARRRDALGLSALCQQLRLRPSSGCARNTTCTATSPVYPKGWTRQKSLCCTAVRGIEPRAYGSLRKQNRAKQCSSSSFEEIELPLSEVLAAMELCGFAVDTDALTDYGKMLDEQIKQLEQRIHQLAGEEFNLNSPKQLGEILFEKLGLPARQKDQDRLLHQRRGAGMPAKASTRSSTRSWSTASLTKLKSTYVDGLLKVVQPRTDASTSTFNQTETRTGRISSTEPNMQNIPVRTELGSRPARRSLRRRPGCDAGRRRLLPDRAAGAGPHLARMRTCIDAFNSGDGHPHQRPPPRCSICRRCLSRPQMRSQAKAVNFGIVYGIGAFSLSQDIGVSVAEADRYIKSYLDTY